VNPVFRVTDVDRAIATLELRAGFEQSQGDLDSTLRS
jgi:hypothetical protein